MNDAIAQYAELQFTPDEIGLIMQIDPRELRAAGKYETDYQRGRLKAQAMIRQQILTMAKNGSSAAQKEFLGLVTESEKPRIRQEILKILEKTKKLVCEDCRAEVIDLIIANVEKMN